MLICYRGIQFLLERKCEIFLDITIFQKVIFPTIKEMVIKEYLSDITNDVIVCLIRAGSVIIRCEIWKASLTIRVGVKGNSTEFAYEKNKRKLENLNPSFQKLMDLLRCLQN